MEERPEPERDHHVDRDDDRHQHAEDHEERDLGPEQPAVDRAEADVAVPEHVGVEVRERGEREERQDQHDRGDHQRARTTGRRTVGGRDPRVLVEQLAHSSSS